MEDKQQLTHICKNCGTLIYCMPCEMPKRTLLGSFGSTLWGSEQCFGKKHITVPADISFEGFLQNPTLRQSRYT
jgi:hypothetical protein